MPLSTTAHLDNLLRHLDIVRTNCILLGRRLIEQGRDKFGRDLIVRGFRHDLSKFQGAEWEFLHAGKDIPKEHLQSAIKKHQRNNSHHPEYHRGIHHMPEICVAEMACDLLARSQELGTDVRQFIEETFVKKYSLKKNSDQYMWLCGFIDTLLENEFVK